jgi:hypothetical protein
LLSTIPVRYIELSDSTAIVSDHARGKKTENHLCPYLKQKNAPPVEVVLAVVFFKSIDYFETLQQSQTLSFLNTKLDSYLPYFVALF